jgi:hypothetical protein
MRPHTSQQSANMKRMCPLRQGNSSSDDMAEQSVNLSAVIYLGVFSRAEQRVLQVIFKGIAEGGGSCAATLAMIAGNSNTSKSTTRNAIAQAVAIGLLEKMERTAQYHFPTF